MNQAFTVFRRLAFLLALLSFPALLIAQTGTGPVQGLVKDPSGAVITGSKVSIVNTETQLTRATTTDGGGHYSFLALSPGQYIVTAEALGFANREEKIQVTVGSHLESDLSLGLGGPGTTVEGVGARGAAVNTLNQEGSSVVNWFDINQMRTLTSQHSDICATAHNYRQDY